MRLRKDAPGRRGTTMTGKQKQLNEPQPDSPRPLQHEQEDFSEGESFADITPGSNESPADINPD